MNRRLIAWLSLSLASVPAQQVIILRSGAGASPGQPDPNVHHLVGPVDSQFPFSFQVADFEAARTGPAAIVTSPRSSAWNPSLIADPAAKWVTTNPVDRTGLYAIDFILPFHVASADMTLSMSVDNQLGITDVTNGLYFNGVEVPGEYRRSGFSGESLIIRNGIEPLLRQGLNTFYIYGHDGSGVSGLIFSATLTIQPLIAPGSFVGFGSGCAGSAGVPTIDTVSGDLPFIGETLDLRLQGLPPTIFNAPFGFIGFSRDWWGTIPLPLDLSSIGMPGCRAFVAVDLSFALTNQGGTVAWPIAIPNDVAFVGATIYVQGGVFDPGANAMGFVVTSAGEATIGAQ